MRQTIIFTDLDGTLLDHESYSCAPALPVLARLEAAGIPVILASSKTAAEIESLQRELRLQDYPAIVENGAGILWPGEAADNDSEAHGQIRATIAKVDTDGRFQGFGDWSIKEVVERTGLDASAAALAKRRRFSEPGTFSGSEAERAAFIAALRRAGLDARMGGRFLTVSAPCSKAERMDEVVQRLFADGAVRTIALGDAPNDVEMLEAADFSIVVANPSHEPLPELKGEHAGRITRTALPGPSGWAEAVGAILDRMEKPT